MTKDPLKHTFVSVEEKLSIVRFQQQKFPKHPTLLIYVAPMSGSGRCCSPIICSSTHHVYLELATRRDAEEGVTLLGSFAPTGL